MPYEKVDGFDRNLLKNTKKTNNKGGDKFLIGGDLELTAQQLEILKMSSEGKTASYIAELLGISESAVKGMVKRMTDENDNGNGEPRPTVTSLAAKAESHGVLNKLFIETLKRKSK